MSWGLGLFGLVLIVVGWGLRALRTPQPSPVADPEFPVDAELDANLEATLTAAKGEQQLSPTALLTLLEPVIRRAAPLRGVRPGPADGATRLLFADGTVVLVRSQGGHLGLLGLRLHRESVVLIGCRPVGLEAELTFRAGHGTLTALAVGLDQAN